jgi:hypothetical protein
VTEIGVSPVASVTAEATAFESTSTKEYMLSCESWPIDLGTLVTRYEAQRAPCSTWQSPKKVEIASFCAVSAGRPSGEEGHRAKPVFVGCTSFRRGPLEPSWARRLE